MRSTLLSWAPAGILVAGAIVTLGLPGQRRLPLRAPLANSVPTEIAGYEGDEVTLSELEQRVAGFVDYLFRVYRDPDASVSGSWFSVYIGYYDQQTQGKTIHSPKNCLPGAGWEPLASETARVPTPGGEVQVNRYLLQRKDERALVFYWYQGRGRVQANEYVVKWDLLRDSALKRRSDEALVRVVVPVIETEDAAFDLATQVASILVSSVDTALPL